MQIHFRLLQLCLYPSMLKVPAGTESNVCVLTALFPEGTNEHCVPFSGSILPVQRISGVGCHIALYPSVAAGESLWTSHQNLTSLLMSVKHSKEDTKNGLVILSWLLYNLYI